jgi:hypothetical protein
MGHISQIDALKIRLTYKNKWILPREREIKLNIVICCLKKRQATAIVHLKEIKFTFIISNTYFFLGTPRLDN